MGRAYALGTAAAGAPLIHVGHCARAWRVFLVQVREIEAGLTDKVIHLAVQMTAARQATPSRSEPVLPAFDAWLGRKSMLDKTEISVWFEHPQHLTQGSQRLRNRAKGPGHHDGINGVVRKRDGSCGPQKKLDRYP